jgi:hypothetical protein
MEEANRRAPQYAPPLDATAYAGIGERDKALTWLQQACADHSPVLAGLRVDPVFDPLRDDPRFQDLNSARGSTGETSLRFHRTITPSLAGRVLWRHDG